MRSGKTIKWLRATLLILVALAMALLCHVAYSPFHILPSGLIYAVYPVAESAPHPLAPGDLAVCVKGAGLTPGAIVKYIQHPLSSFAAVSPVFGYMLEHSEPRGNLYDVYKVQIGAGESAMTLNSARPELVIYRIAGLGGTVMWLNRHRQIILGVCIGVAAAYVAIMGLTAKRRRLKRSREEYIKMFDGFAQRFESESEDY